MPNIRDLLEERTSDTELQALSGSLVTRIENAGSGGKVRVYTAVVRGVITGTFDGDSFQNTWQSIETNTFASQVDGSGGVVIVPSGTLRNLYTVVTAVGANTGGPVTINLTPGQAGGSTDLRVQINSVRSGTSAQLNTDDTLATTPFSGDLHSFKWFFPYIGVDHYPGTRMEICSTVELHTED